MLCHQMMDFVPYFLEYRVFYGRNDGLAYLLFRMILIIIHHDIPNILIQILISVINDVQYTVHISEDIC